MTILRAAFFLALVSSPPPAQDIDRAGALSVAIEYILEARPTLPRHRLVLDTARTASREVDHSELAREVARRLGVPLGAGEDYCFEIPADPPDRTPMRRWQVRGVAGIVAAEFLESTSERMLVSVTLWYGSGRHTGGKFTLELRRDADGAWRVAQHLTTATSVCPVGAGMPSAVPSGRPG